MKKIIGQEKNQVLVENTSFWVPKTYWKCLKVSFKIPGLVDPSSREQYLVLVTAANVPERYPVVSSLQVMKHRGLSSELSSGVTEIPNANSNRGYQFCGVVSCNCVTLPFTSRHECQVLHRCQYGT